MNEKFSSFRSKYKFLEENKKIILGPNKNNDRLLKGALIKLYGTTDNATNLKRKAALKEELEKVEDFIKEYNSSLTNMLKDFSEEIEKYDDKDRNTYMNILKKDFLPHT